MVLAAQGGGGGGGGGEAAGAAKFKSGGGGGAPAGGGQVYMGTRTTSQLEGKNQAFLSGPAIAALGQRKVKVPLILGEKEAESAFDNFSGKQLRDFINAGQVAGQLQDDAGPMEAAALWKKLVGRSKAYTAAGRKISPFDVLQMYVAGGEGGAGGAGASLWQTQYRGGRKFLVNSQTGEVRYQGPRFETTYQKNIDLTDPVTAKAIATSVFQQLMHRDPGKGEMGGFADALRNAEQQSPVVSQSTVEYDMDTGEAIGTSTKSEGGFSSDAKMYLAQQRVKGTKEYGVTQAATTFENALENAVFNNPFGS